MKMKTPKPSIADYATEYDFTLFGEMKPTAQLKYIEERVSSFIKIIESPFPKRGEARAIRIKLQKRLFYEIEMFNQTAQKIEHIIYKNNFKNKIEELLLVQKVEIRKSKAWQEEPKKVEKIVNNFHRK
jgi:hypothetical protein